MENFWLRTSSTNLLDSLVAGRCQVGCDACDPNVATAVPAIKQEELHRERPAQRLRQNPCSVSPLPAEARNSGLSAIASSMRLRTHCTRKLWNVSAGKRLRRSCSRR